ncbi:ABC transporter ATP-binding protein [Paenibacillus fonticola]|uniref:ABC transporter ATP-binding protein n=1 Tax=Paenibacillus fonticola TaxID=379896 RepID=UPI00036B386D|nr:ABC transporter ATP-binding protein [Paenibacillus fonticola]
MRNNLRLIWKYSRLFKRQMAGAFLILIVLTLIGLIPAFLIQRIFDDGLLGNNYRIVLGYGLLLGAVYICRSILNYISTFIFTRMSQGIIYNIREEISQKLFKYPLDFYNYKESGYITSRLNEVNHLTGLFSANTFKSVLGFFELAGVLVILFLYSVPLTLIMCLLIPLYYLISTRLMGSIAKITKEIAEKSAQLNSKIQQSVSGIEEVKNLSLEDKEAQQINAATQSLMKANVRQSLHYSLGLELLILLGSLSTVLLIIASGPWIINGSLTIGVYMIFLSYSPKLYTPIQTISSTALTLQPALISLQRLKIFLEETIEDEQDAGKPQIGDIHSVAFLRTGFGYTQGATLFRDLSFRLGRGDRLMIKGENGTGKTTIFRLLMGLYDCTEGDILLNDMNIKEISRKSLRQRVAVVSQKIFLFNDTIENNIKYGMEHADEAKLDKVIHLTGLEKTIAKMKDKPDAAIGENGSQLSGGEIQRIAIARALLRDAHIFLFDEIAAHLDVAAKQWIRNLLATEFKDSICIFIDHEDYFDDLCNKEITLENYKTSPA